MKMRTIGAAGVSLLLGLGCQSCSLLQKKNSPRESRLTPLLRQNGSIEALEAELSTVRTARVIVPTQLLKALVRNEKIAHHQCKAIAGQLEALKNIDLEEIER